MIHGIGTDVASARDVEASVTRFGRRYLDRLFTPTEQARASRRHAPSGWVEFYAAKEAVYKALRVPPSVAAPWSDIEVADGLARLTGPIGRWAEASGVRTVRVQTSVVDRRADDATVLALAVAETDAPHSPPKEKKGSP